MGIFYDNIEFAERYLDIDYGSNLFPEKSYLNIFFPKLNGVRYSENRDDYLKFWDDILLVNEAEKSQYDTLIELCQNSSLDNEILCLAGEGKRFHGFKSRKWNSHQGNIHLSANFKPDKELQRFSLGFLIISAVSVVQAIDEIEGLNGKATIKWVNDVLIDGKKVSGVLAHCLTQGRIIKDAIIGIGLNVEVNPSPEPTRFVPSSACLNDFLSDGKKVNEKIVFRSLIKHLNDNYQKLLDNGYDELLRFYKERSLVLGKEVSIWTDEEVKENELICKGKVLNIGDNLELEIEGYDKKIINGRLAMEEKL